MRIEGIIWLRDVVDKLVSKHNVETYEVEQVLNGKPKFALLRREKEKERTYIWRWGRRIREDTWPSCSSTNRPKKH